jgi:predicted ArsR family transcriptional regulator
LRREFHRSTREVAQELGIDEAKATRSLVRLCRQGRCMFDLETRRYRHRELFEQPADEAKFFPPDLRRESAARLIADGQVKVDTCCAQETTKVQRLKTPDGPIERKVTYRDWHVNGAVADNPEVQVVVNDNGSIIFGRCTCPFFQTNLMNQGPCEHILALFQASATQRVDRPTSVAAPSEA